ncbi:hypothetical protein GQ57_10155 [Burkholderia sp. MSh2]|uniref:Lipoprotein n=1 Tax=Burkholderia paludis TaxID=1506587 RepID=A0A6J5DPR9_9BURK|nr:hypothetical protein GQ57_10155 [Burkholderia sp. MSh2]CAB3755514.1 hypothetical protein LMG30113_02489 [Burkholderia paludis]VWB36725.1 hypothetical protein BPA30113_01481 [Burkholderia paludis]
MNTQALLAVLLVLPGASSTLAFAQQGDGDACVVLLPTRMMADDVGTPPADGWLGLAPDGRRWKLAPARLRLEPVQPDGEVVDIRSDLANAVALFRCGSLRPGKVDAANVALPNGGAVIEPGVEPLRVGFHGRRYALRYTASGSVIAEGGGRRSVLHDFGGSMPPFRATLIWAGNLDRDGGPDFLMEFESGIGANVCLFTSRGAGRNERVRRAGCTEISG